MRSPSSACTPMLVAHALHIASLVLSPLIARKYFVIAGIPASCSVLVAPIPLFITYFFISQHGNLYARQAAWRSTAICLLVASILWLINQIPTAPHSIVDSSTWQSVLGIAPRVIICSGLLYSLLQWIIGWLYTKPVHTQPTLIAIASVGWCGILACSIIGLAHLTIYRSLSISIISILTGSFFWFTTATLCIGGALEFLKKLAKHRPSVSKAANQTKPLPPNNLYLNLVALFWIALLLTNIVVVKWFKLKSYFFTLGVLTYPFTFIFTDLISELYGKQKSTQAIWGGFIASGYMVSILILVNMLPAYKQSPVSQQAFSQVFAFTPGVVLASMAAYLTAQFADIHLFEILRRNTQGKHLWLRNNLATIVSQFLDTIVFSLFAWIIWPSLDPSAGSAPIPTQYWYKLTVNEYRCKLVLALLDTPLVYAALKVIRKYK